MNQGYHNKFNLKTVKRTTVKSNAATSEKTQHKNRSGLELYATEDDAIIHEVRF